MTAQYTDKTIEELVQELDIARQRIADLEAVEARYQQAEASLRTQDRAMMASHNGIIIVDATLPDMPIIYCNRAFEQITGYPQHEILGRNCRFLQGPETDPATIDNLRQAIAEQREAHVVLKNYRKDGSPFWNELTISPVWDDDGLLTHFVGIQNDITARHTLEESLGTSERRYRIVSELTSDYAYAMRVNADHSLTIEWVTDAFTRITGYTLAEINGAAWSKLIYPDDTELTKQRALNLFNNQPDTAEFRIVTKAGHIRWLRDYSRPVWDEAEGRVTMIYGAAQDITEQKQTEVELKQHATQLTLINDIGQQIAAVLSFDNVFTRAADLLQETFDYYHVGLFVIEEQQLTLKAIAGSYKLFLPLDHTQPISEGINGRVAITGEKIVANDVSQNRFYISRLPQDAVIQSELCLPIKVSGETIGTLDIQSPRQRAFGENDVFGLEILANQIGVALENAQLYETVQHELQEKERAQKVLRIQGRAMAAVRNGIVIADANQPTLPIIYCNPAFEQMSGYAKPEVVGQPLLFLHGSDTDTDALDKLHTAIDNQRGRQVIVKNYHKDGSLFWNEFTISPVWDRAGRLTHYVGIHNDITKRKRAELEQRWLTSELQASEERFRQVISSISDHIYVSEITSDGIYDNLYLSPHVEAMTGYPKERFMADWASWQAVIHPDDRGAATRQAEQLARGQDSEVEYRLVRADGTVIWVRDSGRVTRENRSLMIYGIVSDITERKRLEEQLHQAQKLEAIGRLAGGIAHDFNNILMVINGQTELLLNRTLADDDPTRQEIEEIRQASEQATLLVRQLLAFGRRQPVEPQRVDLAAVVDSTEKMLRRLVAEEVTLQIHMAEPLGHVEADPEQMKQVLMNLVINASDAMPNGGTLTLAASNVSVTAAQAEHMPDIAPGAYVLLRVTDTGTGIDAETQTHIFEPFFTTKAVGKGTGLGLSTVYGIIKQNGGHILLDSEVGRGTTFRIYMPLAANSSAEVPSSEAEPESTPTDTEQDTNPETILLVEDEASVRMITRRFLQKQGYTILEAESAAQALTMIEENSIDLLITDVIMPQMTGIELAEAVKAAQPDIKVLFVSGYSDEALIEHGVSAEHITLLEKPFSAQDLTSIVRQLLNGG